MKAKTVTVVIPNYNGEDFIEPCLRSLSRQSFTDFRLVFIDNGSKDGSTAIFKECIKKYGLSDRTELICNSANRGFCGAVNQGIKAAYGSRYVILLNNDTEVHKDFVRELVTAIERNKRIFSVSSKMLRYYDREKIDNAGDEYMLLGWSYKRGDGKASKNYKKRCRILSACGGAAIYRRKVFDRIGLFDENHFAYLEDVDIGYRANIYGYINVFCPKAEVYHIGSGSTGGERHNEFKVKMAAKNNILLLYKNMPIFQMLFNFPFICAGWVIKLVYFSKIGLAKAFLKGTREGFKSLGKSNRVPFRTENLANYIWLELRLIRNCIGRLTD